MENTEKDPVEDREEFMSRIESIFRIGSQTKESFVESLMLNDPVKEEECRAHCQLRLTQKKHYLSEYDKAVNSDERRKVVGSVSVGFVP